MTQNQNQFAITPEVGDVDLQYAIGNILPCAVASSQATPLVAGEAVKIEDSAGGVPKVLALAANTDETFGFVKRSLKDINFPANQALEIARDGTVMWMVASAAIARGAYVQYNFSTKKVATNAGVLNVVGQTLDKALADTDIIRVQIINRVPMALDQISNVTLTTPASGEVLEYNGTIWVNATDNT